jgi:hypothetical protein
MAKNHKFFRATYMRSARKSKRTSKMKLRIRNRLQLRTHVIVGSIIMLLTGAFVSVFFFGDSENARASSSGDYRTRQSGNWEGSSTWEKYNGYYWSTTSSAPDDDDKVITIRNGHTITIDENTDADELVIEAGGTLKVDDKSLKIKDGSGVDLTVYGTLTMNSKIKLEKNGSISIYGTLNHNADNFDLKDHTDIEVFSGGLVVHKGGDMDDDKGDWHFYNGSTYEHDRNGGSIVKAFWALNSTCLLTGITNDIPSKLDQNFGNFTFNSTSMSGNRSLGSSFETVLGNLTIISTGSGTLKIADNSNKNLTVGGNYIHQGGEFYFTQDGDADMNIGGNMTVSGGVAGLSRSGNGSPVYNINGNLTISGGIFDLSQYSGNTANKGIGTVNLKGNLTSTGGALTETASGSGKGIINFSGTSVQNFMRTGSVSNTIDAVVKNNAILNMGIYSFTGSGTFTVSSGATIKLGSTAGITSSGATGNVQVTGTRSFSSTADYEYNGTSAQVTGSGLPTTVSDLTINNAAGVTLTNNISAKDNLILTNGVVTTGSRSLIVGTSISTIGSVSRTNGWVNGNLSRYIPMLTTGTFVFPVGVSAYNEFTATYTSAPTLGGMLTVNFVQSTPAASGLPLFESNDYKVNTIGDRGYWNITPSLGLIGGMYRIAVLGNGFTGISDVANVRVLSRLSSALPWSLLGSHQNGTGSISNVLATRGGISLPGQVTIGWGYNALPIELIAFDAKVEEKNVRLRWSTATEINNDYFTLERSADGRNFEKIGIVRGSGNTTTRRDYDFLDESPLDGESYYRMRQTDYDGKFEVFDPKRVEFKKAALDDSKLTVWPNPFEDRFELEMESELSGLVTISIIGVDGRTIYTDKVEMNSFGLKWSFTDGNNLLTGTYILRVQLNDEILSRKLIRR